MSYLVLARKYRPQTFEAVVEQHHVTQTLKNAIAADRVAHAILLSGPRGTGKTTVARLLAKAMNCKEGPAPVPCNACPSCREITEGRSSDVFEIDGASNNSVDQVRELRENSRYMPVSSRFKIYIIDEVHMLSQAAFNALLKTLEEPPDHVMFIFATTEPHKIPVTIHSRCQRYHMRRVPLEPLVDHLKSLCESEGIGIPEESLLLIGREAGGSVRDALSLLDQVMTCAVGPVTHDQVLEILGAVNRKVILEMGEALMDARLPSLLDQLRSLHDRGHDLRKLYGDLLEHFRNLLVVKLEGASGVTRGGVDLPTHEIEEMARQVAGRSAASIHQAFDQLFRDEVQVRLSPQPKLAFELALIRICRMRPVLSIDELIEKVDQLRSTLFQATTASDPATAVNADTRGDTDPPAPTATQPEPAAAPQASTPSPDRTERSKSPSTNPDAVWAGVCDQLARDFPALAPGLRSARLIKVDDGRIEIEVEGSSFVLSRLKRRSSLKAITAVCNAQFGGEMELVLHEKAREGQPAAQKKKREQTLQREALSHPMVAEAMELFQGKVIEVKVFDEPKDT